MRPEEISHTSLVLLKRHVNLCCIAVFKFLVKSKKYIKKTILPVVLYVCEISSFTLREERRLRVFENRILMQIESGEGSTMKKICSLYRSPNIVRVIKSGRL